jgi:hypothetical protein
MHEAVVWLAPPHPRPSRSRSARTSCPNGEHGRRHPGGSPVASAFASWALRSASASATGSQPGDRIRAADMPFTRLRKRPACVIGPLTTLGEKVSWSTSSSGLLAARAPAGLWIKNRVKRTRRDPPRDLRTTRVSRCVGVSRLQWTETRVYFRLSGSSPYYRELDTGHSWRDGCHG